MSHTPQSVNGRSLCRRGTTLVDVLFGIAAAATCTLCVAALAGPPGTVFESPGKVLHCRDRLRSLADGMAAFAFDHWDAIAGPNTSGADGQAGLEQYWFDQESVTPTSTHDWMSPTMGDELNLSVNRAQRLQQLLNDFACPEALVSNNALFGSAPDQAQFQARFAQGGFRQVSYLSPSAFHYFPNTAVAQQNLYHGVRLIASQGSPVAVNPNYRPRLDLVGTMPLMKAYAADGVRYFESNNLLDLDISATPTVNGNFLDAGPIVHSSTAYGRASPSNGRQLSLSFRHRGQTNVAFFDGHVGRISQADAWRIATPWYPSGSVFNGMNATPESNDYYSAPEDRVIP